jgi:uroporphyrinogen-III synthase
MQFDSAQANAVLILRPEPDLSALSRAFSNAAPTLEVLPWASLDICKAVPAQDWDSGLDYATSSLKLIFISRNAVREGLPHLSRVDRAQVACLCVGAGSAALLREQGFTQVFVANEGGSGDSEQLLALPQLQSVTDAPIVIVQGEGGRELIAPVLKRRGAKLHSLVCYRRQVATTLPELVRAVVEWQQLKAVVTFSVESWQAALALMPTEHRAYFLQAPTFCAHPRVASRLQGFGAKSTFLFQTPSTDDTVREILSLLSQV